ncbi:3-deoxy-7-phosphoheptulonate synthase [Candidatus Daviesbacteria bacterium]|nr:3-deoxy-7-phosphoheptulonate synthase [Candidatus Daviesbacteria bacterium]
MNKIESNIINTRVTSITPIESPIELKKRITNGSDDLVVKTRREIGDILHGRDSRRLLLVVGPCSIHDPEQAIEYAETLIDIKKRVEDDLVIVMRTYFEKPRTTVGWKGLAYDPSLDGSAAPGVGLAISRQVLSDVNKLGLPCAVEFLDPFTPQYFDELVSWAAIGARTTESQTHRQLASGLSMPVGFKNSTEGNIKVAADAMVSAASSHTFYGIDASGRVAVVKTNGNPDTHIVLRGSNKGTNYDAVSIGNAVNLVEGAGLLTESSRPIMIDCSHGNSSKDYKKQSGVAENVLDQIKTGQRRIMGLLIESNLVEGQQSYVPGKTPKRGVSLTDGCIGWKETERLLLNFARSIRLPIYALT